MDGTLVVAVAAAKEGKTGVDDGRLKPVTRWEFTDADAGLAPNENEGAGAEVFKMDGGGTLLL